MRAVIMAQGRQERMGNAISVPKQLLPFAGETVVGRTVRILRALGVYDVVVVARTAPEWASFCSFHRVDHVTLPETGDGAAAGIWRARHLDVGPPTLWLLGDVVYSRAVLKDIVSRAHGRWFWCRGREQNPVTMRSHPEVYALRLQGDGASSFFDFCASCEENKTSYSLHTALETLGWGEGILGKERWATNVKDYTDDLDTPEDLAALPALERASELEGPWL